MAKPIAIAMIMPMIPGKMYWSAKDAGTGVGSEVASGVSLT
jgi:hypothetical protein